MTNQIYEGHGGGTQITGEHVRNIAMDIVLTLVTCGIYNVYIQYKQMQALNSMLGQPKYVFLNWLLLTLVTCGLYHIYHEYRMSLDIAGALKDPHSQEPILVVILSIFGLSIVADAIQQAHINEFYGSKQL